MARPLRIEFAGALYHVTARGNRQEDIFEEDNDREKFISIFQDVCEQYNWVCHAYCLMGNHYHLLIETPDANLSKGMRHLNGVYTQAFNRKHNRVGHLFQGRFKAILVERDSYLLELTRYIVLNPVRAAMVRAARDWQWSSYQAVIGQVNKPVFLEVDWLLSAFGKKESTAISAYIKFVSEGNDQPSPWSSLKNQIYLGGDKFVQRMQLLIDEGKELSEVPSAQRRPVAKALSSYESNYSDRNTAIVAAYKSGGYTLKAIAEYFGLHYSTVSGIVKNHKSKT